MTRSGFNLNSAVDALELDEDAFDDQAYDADDLESLRSDQDPLYPRKPSRTTMKRTWRKRCR